MTVLIVVNEDNKSDGRRVDASEKHCCLDLTERKQYVKKEARERNILRVHFITINQ
jgi:hypothetical protein